MLAEKFAAHPDIVLLTLNSGSEPGPAGVRPADVRGCEDSLSQKLFEKAAAEIKAVLRGLLGQGKKVIVCDLDNTLWGGVLGDDGPENIRLGAPDPLGECFHTFQAVLKGLRQRGILLAICSKNDEQVALSVIQDHPAMVLRKERLRRLAN